MPRGSCLCGAVRYEVRGSLGDIVLCHCSQCRKAQGGAFGANASVNAADFDLEDPETRLVEYESSPGKLRAFCGRCGSPIYSRLRSRPEVVRLRIGTLDTPIDGRPVAHIFAGSKAEWDTIDDGLPQFDGREPGRR